MLLELATAVTSRTWPRPFASVLRWSSRRCMSPHMAGYTHSSSPALHPVHPAVCREFPRFMCVREKIVWGVALLKIFRTI
jgi:hypothetical protein